MIITYTIALIIIFVITALVMRHLQYKSGKFALKNYLLVFWDINCKLNVLPLINSNYNYKLVHISEIGFIIQIDTNYFCFMTKHPQEYNNIDVLFNEMTSVIKKYNIQSIVSFSTAGSGEYEIGQVVQYYSAYVYDSQKYHMDDSMVVSKNILLKTSVITDSYIIDTKGFIVLKDKHLTTGQDEFAIYVISNKLNVPCLTLTGISDHNNPEQYKNGGGQLAAQKLISYFQDNFSF
jgi:hypothetical protein